MNLNNNFSKTDKINSYVSTYLDYDVQWWVSHNLDFNMNTSSDRFICKNCCNKFKNIS